MTYAQRLRKLANSTGLDAFGDEIRAIADEMDAQPAEVTRDEVMQAAKEATAPEWQDVVDGWHMGLDLMAFARAILALRPEPTTLTGCKCRWDGDTQVEWCDLHLAHKEAIHEWAERAKEAEKQLALRTERVPMTEEEIVHAYCVCNVNDAPAGVWFEAGARAAEKHHFGTKLKDQA